MRIDEGLQFPILDEGHPFLSDPVLPALLKRLVPATVLTDVGSDLVRFGNDVSSSIRDLGARVAPPTFVQYNQWGHRIDDLRSSEGFRLIKSVCQKEGIPAIFYERKYGEYSRIYGFTKLAMICGDSHMVLCPLSMTDGAARVIELSGTQGMKDHIFPRLISRDTSHAFVSGQWMTERPGGSDVSLTETAAKSAGKTHTLGPQYSLNGFKWFSSATESDIAIALARTGTLDAGSRGLSLFLVPLRTPLLRQPTDPTPHANSNKIFVHRLKNKIGTHAVPTAELSLEDTEAYLIGEFNQGIKNISPVLNITRVWSAVGSVGYLRRALAIATAYANFRTINGGKQLLRDTPLHVAQLASVNLTYRALAHLVLGAVVLLGKSECGTATREEAARLRVLTPMVKAFAAEKTSGAIEEAMASIGGQGYMEETQIGRLLRDCLVEKIWEGTVTVLSLDVIRVFKDRFVLETFISWGENIISSCPSGYTEVAQSLNVLRNALGHLHSAYQTTHSLMPRPAVILMGYVVSSLFLLEQALWSHATNQSEAQLDAEVFNRWSSETGMRAAIDDVVRIQNQGGVGQTQRSKADSKIVFGAEKSAKL